ncbi:S8 family serine peptidase [Nonomuraea sp. NPDC059194]|uniref:S8 family peptidase n=1 Tax=Nonomuraea sp. NPDC059194 TaxID=3346764 RepID=UPI0036C89441
MDIQAVGAALIRPGQILTDRGAMSAAAQWTQAVAEADGVFRIRLTPGVDPCEIALRLREEGFRASPNHVLAGQPLWFGGPASRPFPSEPVEAPSGEGTPATVGVLDTGIADHPWWSGSDWYGRLGPETVDRPNDDGNGGGRLAQQAGHGTFIAGLIQRRAPGSVLRVARVLGADGLGDEAGLLRALNRLRDNPPQVLNLSLGCHTFDDKPSSLVADALATLPGTVTVACAGNTASDRPFWPAALPGVVGVGGLDAAEERRAPFSAFGPWVDAWARSEWLTSAFLEWGEFGGYAHWSGTSFAAALVSGAFAAAPSARAAADLPGAREIADLRVVVPAGL